MQNLLKLCLLLAAMLATRVDATTSLPVTWDLTLHGNLSITLTDDSTWPATGIVKVDLVGLNNPGVPGQEGAGNHTISTHPSYITLAKSSDLKTVSIQDPYLTHEYVGAYLDWYMNGHIRYSEMYLTVLVDYGNGLNAVHLTNTQNLNVITTYPGQGIYPGLWSTTLTGAVSSASSTVAAATMTCGDDARTTYRTKCCGVTSPAGLDSSDGGIIGPMTCSQLNTDLANCNNCA